MGDNLEDIQQMGFTVVYCSGRKSQEPTDANVVTKRLLNGDGWISEKYIMHEHSKIFRECHFPQKMIIKLDRKISLRKVQMLAHNAFVPTKVDMFVCENMPEDKDDFDKLGTAAFRDNVATSFNARELKTIFLECDALFLKLTVHRNHLSKENKLDQVGIMAVEFFGIPIGGKDEKIDYAAHRARDLITRDHQRRMSIAVPMDKSKRMATAKARSVLDRNYAKEASKVKRCLQTNAETASGGTKDKLKVAVKAIDNASDSAMLILQQERSALSENDDEYASACHAEVHRIFLTVYDTHDVHALLSEKQAKSCGLDAPKKTSTSKKPSRARSQARKSSSNKAPLGRSRSQSSRRKDGESRDGRESRDNKESGKLRRKLAPQRSNSYNNR